LLNFTTDSKSFVLKNVRRDNDDSGKVWISVQIDLMKKFVATVRHPCDLLLNWFKNQGLSCGIVEGSTTK